MKKGASFFLHKYPNHCAIMLVMNHYIFCLASPINLATISCKAENCQLKKLSMRHIEINSIEQSFRENYSVCFIAEIVNSF